MLRNKTALACVRWVREDNRYLYYLINNYFIVDKRTVDERVTVRFAKYIGSFRYL